MKWFRVREMGICMAIASALGTSPLQAQLALEVGVEPAGAGVVANYPNLATFVEGESVTVTATPAEGFEFSGWQGDIVSSASSMTFEMTANTSLVAVFAEAAPAQYTLTAFVDPSGAGTIVREPADFSYDAGTEVTVTAFAGDGFVFTGWTGDVPESADAQSSSLTLTMDADLDVRATFAAGLTLQEDEAGGAACGAVGMISMGLMFALMGVMKLSRSAQ